MTAPPRPRPAPFVAEVVRTEHLAATMVRVVVGGPGLAGFAPSPHADSYVKVLFLPAGSPRPLREDGRLDLDAVRASLPPDAQPRQRSYTVRAFDPAAGELTLDFVVHGDEGIAGPWAASAKPGDEVLLSGPGGAWSPDPGAASHLFAGDASALPAIAVALERLPADAVGHAVVEVHGPEDEIPLTSPAGVQVLWVHQGVAVAGLALVDTVVALPELPAPVSAFVHGEAGAVRELRKHVRTDRGVTREQLSVSGYWRLGTDDEGWRATKRDWLATIEHAEAAQGLS
ncbi:siderophore-interacting protein [Cellulomonas humilata]|uniref:Siderophore-interacting protein n=1 Tax=Cellulomonas humilata TaxID=144055 RepID=A0A7Y6DVV0_9CELL|nr:siderophore-interacting protein [Cellulomonas humilata]NUU16836.1 siderophore-interacting protein [Cellulomonas humilata]